MASLPQTIYVRMDGDREEGIYLTAEKTLRAVVEDEDDEKATTLVGTYILKCSGRFKKAVQRA